MQSLNLLALMKSNGFDPAAEQLEIFQEALFHYKRATAIMERIDSIEDESRRMLMRGMLDYQLAREDTFRYLALMRATSSDLMNFVYPKKKSVEFVDENGENAFKNFAEMIKAVGNEERRLQGIANGGGDVPA